MQRVSIKIPYSMVQRSVARLMEINERPEIRDAAEGICRLAMGRSLEESRIMWKSSLGQESFAAWALRNPTNIQLDLMLYLPVDVVLQAIFAGDQQICGVQIASSFAPYLYYMQVCEQRFDFVAVDIDEHAIDYARHRLGLNAVQANARHMLPFSAGTLHAVVTNHFLDDAYSGILDRLWSETHPRRPGQTRQTVLTNIAEVLRPGGYYISAGYEEIPLRELEALGFDLELSFVEEANPRQNMLESVKVYRLGLSATTI